MKSREIGTLELRKCNEPFIARNEPFMFLLFKHFTLTQ